ncbi:thioesterase [Phenylobacterium deserti]|uniref:Thioesterase n=2 Tax=Phenylobacterium deserti TaxID=1914756 RepID=A0A328AR25_9CAUL|nr:thioesterase [Phenylobacterium deserti]
MGHLNVGFYVAKSMEALVGLAAEIGMPHAFAPHAEATMLVRDQHIRFLKEARPGAALSMTGGVLEMGHTDARLLMILRHASGEAAAVFQTQVTHATARQGSAFPWTASQRRRGEDLKVELLAELAPRSIDTGPVVSQASLERADQLGLVHTGLGAVRSVDCDAFGRMRPEVFMARISDGIGHLITDRGGEPGRRIGGAALEYRLLHFGWPRSGDRVALRSGYAGGDARFRRFVHWLVDPVTGKAWGSAEAIAVSFDLDTRKIVTLTDEQRAEVDRRITPGLAL